MPDDHDENGAVDRPSIDEGRNMTDAVWVVVVSNEYGDDAWVSAVVSTEDAAKSKLASLGGIGRVEGPFTVDDPNG